MTHLHFMGIGGQGISAVAQMALQAGEVVTGCDRQLSATVRAIQQAGIPVQMGHSPDHLEGVDTLVISPAVPALDPHNPELLAARERGIQIVTWQELFGSMVRERCVLSVSGVHGKSTTTSLLSLILIEAGLDPTCVIGAVVPQLGTNYRLGVGQYVVNEADEFNHNFWHYHPRLAIVKSIEFEHPEFFADYDAFLSAFEHFIRGMDMHGDWPVPPTLLLNADNSGCWDLQARLTDWPGRMLTYSLGADSAHGPAAFEAYNIQLDGETSFQVRARTGTPFPEERTIHLQLPGLHSVENALSALAVAHCIGIAADSIIQTLEGFTGTRRRFDIRHQGALLSGGEEHHVMLVDDYAHHPTAITLTLEAARRRYPDRRLLAVYQPHMYSRTKTFFEQFVQAFDGADIVVIADIFPARERDTGIIHARDLVDAIKQRPRFLHEEAHVYHGGDIASTTRLLRKLFRSGDLALLMGAGDIYTVTEQLLSDTEEG